MKSQKSLDRSGTRVSGRIVAVLFAGGLIASMGTAGCVIEGPTSRLAASDSCPEVLPLDAPGQEVPAIEVELSFFQDALRPHGEWILAEGQWMWRPTVAVMDGSWMPYCDGGQWVYTESGWFWLSDYSWGWAPFHYGRWHHHPSHGWVWFPGTEWGPAWVEWRCAGEYFGWAPLPPVVIAGPVPARALAAQDFVFLRSEHLVLPQVRPHRLCPEEAFTAYGTTRSVNGPVVGNRTVIDVGPDRRLVERSLGREIRKVRLVDVGRNPGEPLRAAIPRAEALPVYRPGIAHASTRTALKVFPLQAKRAETDRKAWERQAADQDKAFQRAQEEERRRIKKQNADRAAAAEKLRQVEEKAARKWAETDRKAWERQAADQDKAFQRAQEGEHRRIEKQNADRAAAVEKLRQVEEKAARKWAETDRKAWERQAGNRRAEADRERKRQSKP